MGDAHALLARTLGDNSITKWDSTALQQKRASSSTAGMASLLFQLIDRLGTASGKAQGLPHVLTTASKLIQSTDQRLYMYSIDGQGAGLLKVGKKKLFIRTDVGTYKEIEPLCVLDFYVNEDCQRTGIGKKLFDHMLRAEQVEPHLLAYDRPSPKLLAFLGKHFHLKNYTPQANNFVVYQKYFDHSPVSSSSSSSSYATINEQPLTARSSRRRSIHDGPPSKQSSEPTFGGLRLPSEDAVLASKRPPQPQQSQQAPIASSSSSFRSSSADRARPSLASSSALPDLLEGPSRGSSADLPPRSSNLRSSTGSIPSSNDPSLGKSSISRNPLSWDGGNNQNNSSRSSLPPRAPFASSQSQSASGSSSSAASAASLPSSSSSSGGSRTSPGGGVAAAFNQMSISPSVASADGPSRGRRLRPYA